MSRPELSNLTNQEQVVLDLSAALWNAFTTLPVQHPDDVHDFRKSIHDIQRIIAARPALRDLAKQKR